MLSRLTSHAVPHYFVIVVVIPLCVFLVMVPYSLFLKWDLLSLLLFWFVTVPFVILFSSTKFLKKKNAIWKSVISLISFYSLMVFMIYKHYQSDFFTIMMISFLWNLLIMLSVMIVEHVDRTSENRRHAHR